MNESTFDQVEVLDLFEGRAQRDLVRGPKEAPRR